MTNLSDLLRFGGSTYMKELHVEVVELLKTFHAVKALVPR